MKTQSEQIKQIRNEHFIKDYLKQLVRSDGEIMTRKEWILKHKIVGLDHEVRDRASKKVCLEYKPIKNPKITYFLKSQTGILLEVPKILHDNFNYLMKEVQS